MIVGGLAAQPADPEGGNLSAKSFLERLIDDPSTSRRRDYSCRFDAVAMHGYLHERRFNSGNPAKLVGYFQDSFRSVLIGAGAGDMQTWVTEFGARRVKGFDSATAQKKWVSAVSGKLARHRKQWKLGPLMHFTWQDNTLFPGDAALTGLWQEPGVVGGSTGNRKPAGAAAATRAKRYPGGITLPAKRSC